MNDISRCGKCGHKHRDTNIACDSVCRYCKRRARRAGRRIALKQVKEVEEQLGIRKEAGNEGHR